MDPLQNKLRINLSHLIINQQKQIGIQFYPNKIIQSLIKGIPGIKWSKKYNMAYLPNTKRNIGLIFSTFRGVCWVNGQKFFTNKPVNKGSAPLDLTSIRKKKIYTKDWLRCPETYLQKLEIKKYAYSTAKTYISCFEKFINYYKNKALLEINDQDIRNYLTYLIRQERSDTYINQSINSIKFYYEIVLEMPNRFYNLDRPKKKKYLPKVLSQKEIASIISATKNLKHRCILSLLYSTGVRMNELLELKISDIDSDRMMIHVRDAKGGKDRYVQLSSKLLPELRKYFIEYRPKIYLFEGAKGGKYSSTSVGKIIKKAASSVGIHKKVTAHIFRHSFATHLLENGTNLRQIQKFLGHSSIKTTEIYTHISNSNFKLVKNPFDSLT